ADADVNRLTESVIESTATDLESDDMAGNNDDYRNLVNEYRDGILLFDISNRKVWEPASKDAEALQAYFAEHRDKYTWDKPHFKGCVVFTTNDSLRSEVQAFLAANTIERDSLVTSLRDRFGKDVKLERVNVAKGDNAIIDELAFGGPKADPVGRWNTWFAYDWKVIDAPEEALDVKAAVSTDLQSRLEEEWVKDLRKRYKVKLNKKQLDKLTR
ncbi:MAG: hypothetical protein K2H87_02175, partial [Duncaniella sp.]|nr:hypothetical protein [Duncaniella sp.]